MGFQERDVLLLEGPLPMVFFLIPIVSNCIVHLSDPYAEGSVPFLPFEAPMRTELIVDPFRRTTLDQPHCFGDLHCRRKGEQNVDVVLYAAYPETPHLVLAGDSAHKGPEPLLQWRCDVAFTPLCAKYTMKQVANVGVTQIGSLAPKEWRSIL